ncbi:MAG: hypothetical protein V1656_02755 [Candidatus Jorgensenbacteria bacterium]
MNKSTQGIIYAAVAIVLVGGGYFLFTAKPWGAGPAGGGGAGTNVALASFTNAKGEKWQIPAGDYEFNVSSAEKYPKIVKGFINPLDVKVGDVQKMAISINGDAPMKRVWAEVETDNSTKTVELSIVSTSTVAAADILKQPYLVDANGYLVINDGKNSLAERIVKIAEAKAPITQYRYEGEWTVEDTHTRTYHTKFNVEDTANRSDSMTLAWSDPSCFFNSGGLLNDTCIPSSGATEGFDGANSNLNGKTLTLNTGGAFAFNGGTNGEVQIGTGHVVLGGGSLTQTFLYFVDADGDGYVPDLGSGILTNSAASWAGHVRLKDVQGNHAAWASWQVPESASFDCYDVNTTGGQNAHPGQTAFFTTSRDGAGNFDYNCNGAANYNPADAYISTNNQNGSICSYDVGTSTCSLITGHNESFYQGYQTTVPSCGQSGSYLNGGAYDCSRWDNDLDLCTVLPGYVAHTVSCN